MPAKDLFHDAVRIALEKDGWEITNDPLYFTVGEVDFYIDLGAEQLIAAERGPEKIAVEIKSFSAPSLVNAFHEALGKFINYRAALKESDSERVLFLAIPKSIHEDFFQRPFIQKMIRLEEIKLLIYEPRSKTIVKWID
jgi:hypothetical protein